MKEVATSLGSAVRQTEVKIADVFAGSVLDKTLGKTIQQVDEQVRDKIITWSYQLILQFGQGHGLKTSRGKKWYRKWTDCLYQGKEAPFAVFAAGILDGFNRNYYNREVLKQGSGILFVNHPEGPLQGNWFTLALDEAVVTRFGGLEFTPRWFHKEYSDNPILNKTNLRTVRDRYSQLLSQSCNTLLLSRDPRRNVQLIREARDHLAQERLLVFCYEGQESKVLTKADPGVGLLLKAICADWGVPVYPVGCWQQENNLNLSFGKPFFLGSLGTAKEIAHFGAVKIARLLPEEKRGVYRKFVK